MDQTRAGRSSWKDVADHIRLGIRDGKFVQGGKLPSESELMRDHGASKMTVHRALRELSAEGLVRRVERVGTFVADAAAAPTRKIGLILPTTEGFLEFNMLSGVRDGLASGDQFVLYASDNDPVAEYEALNRAASEVDGILILPTCHPKTSRKLQQLYDDGLPVVCLDRAISGCNLPAVTTDNYHVSRSSLDHLAAEGHKRVAYFGIYDERVSTLSDRFHAFQQFCTATLGISADPYIRFIPPHIGVHIKVSLSLVEDALLRMLAAEEPVTLAFCANEFYLEAIVEVSHGLPKELVERLEILSFSDYPRLRYPGFRVHVIRQDAKGMGREAARLLDRVMRGGKLGTPRVEVPATFFHADDEKDDRAAASIFVSRPRPVRHREGS